MLLTATKPTIGSALVRTLQALHDEVWSPRAVSTDEG
jgi:hypothetical protein